MAAFVRQLRGPARWALFSAPIVLGMAIRAATHGVREVVPTLQALWRTFEFARGKRAGLRAEDRPPADGESYSRSQKKNQHAHRNEKNLAQLFHCLSPDRNLCSFTGDSARKRKIWPARPKRASAGEFIPRDRVERKQKSQFALIG